MRKKNNQKTKIINYSPGRGLNVRLRGKRLANNIISLYLDYYQGYIKDNDKIKTKRKVEYLKVYLTDNPGTPEERLKNGEALRLAQMIRNNRESDLQHNSEGLIAPFRKKTNFIDYCEAYQNSYQKKDIRMIKAAISEFKSFTNQNYLTPALIDEAKVKGYRDYLINKFHGETPNSVFARFKKILNAATEEGLFIKNPAQKITCKIPEGIPKEILTPDEIIKLSKTECGNTQIKRAFLLSLNTGLRFVDITDLKYKHITNGLIKKPQQKTGREVSIDLNNTAINLIGKMGQPDEFIFNLPSFNGCIKTLRNWAKKAGINKKITWHSARHSFATILLMNKTDIKTVGSLLGHSKIEHTQKYTHIVNELKAQAVKSLPDITI
ncbi:MAG TPA: site-specific integrase [Bacteroidales bacterium]|nr:site-specific integrase [Bacteroidales bacterium]HPM87427.1 site-specific integrase [Bacteroidales bacterium]